MMWYYGNPVEGGCADIGLDNIRGHIEQKKPYKRVLNQAKEFDFIW